jgi:hypothetical protein
MPKVTKTSLWTSAISVSIEFPLGQADAKTSFPGAAEQQDFAVMAFDYALDNRQPQPKAFIAVA